MLLIRSDRFSIVFVYHLFSSIRSVPNGLLLAKRFLQKAAERDRPILRRGLVDKARHGKSSPGFIADGVCNRGARRVGNFQRIASHYLFLLGERGNAKQNALLDSYSVTGDRSAANNLSYKKFTTLMKLFLMR